MTRLGGVNSDRDDDDENEADENEIEGPIVSIITGCPAPELMIGTMMVMTDSLTVPDDIECADLMEGLDVEVEGVRQNDGSLLAARIEPGAIQSPF
jgi:hypothetical protein